MSPEEPDRAYHLGYSDAEQERLIRQAARLAPVSERFLREAGIAPGQRVLDLGSGVGDIAMLAAKIVGPAGTVVAIERDGSSIARARSRAAQAGFDNIEFVRTEIDEYSPASRFDAVIGRYVLQFLADPAATLRSIVQYVRPGGVVAFQEGSWAPFLALSSHLPLWSAVISLLYEAGAQAGVNLEMGPAMHAVFLEAGLPAPQMRLEMELGSDPDFTRWSSDTLQSVLPKISNFGLSCAVLGELDTLQERLQTEVASSNTVVPWIGLVGAWCRKPDT